MGCPFSFVAEEGIGGESGMQTAAWLGCDVDAACGVEGALSPLDISIHTQVTNTYYSVTM